MGTKTPALLTEAQLSKERLTTMARVFTRADRVLSGQQVVCRLTDEPNNNAPAWSDGKNITFNVPHVGKVTSVDDIIKVTGLNYHELSHILYTPRTHTGLVKQVRNKGIFPAFNMLEDQRIETLLVTKYPSTKPFFVACFMRYLLANRDQWALVFPLAHGRKYLPSEVRAQTMARYKDQAIVADLVRIIDEYRTLAFPRDDQRGLVLIEEYANLLKPSGTPTGDPFGHIKGQRPDAPSQGTPTPHQGTADKAADESDDEPTADENSDDAEGMDDDDVTGSSDGDDSDDDDQDSDGGGKSDSDDDADDEDDDEWPEDEDGGDDTDSDEDGDFGDDDLDGDTGGGQTAGSDDSDGADGDDSGSSGTGEGKSGDGDETGSGVGKGGSSTAPTVAPISDEDFADLLDDAATKAESDDNVQQDAKAKQDVITRGDGDTLSELDAQAYNDAPVSADLQKSAKQFAKALRLLRDEQDPGWLREQATGRLNVQRAMRGDDLDRLFDRWDEGRNDAEDIEAVVLLDYSGSMSAMMKDASESMWAIKRAFEDVGGKVTVIGYSDNATLMYDGTQKVARTTYKSFGTAGGTEPGGALNEAARILHKTRRKSKFLISISDGAWGEYSYYGSEDSEPYKQKIARFNAHGVVTAMLYVLPAMYSQNDRYKSYRQQMIDSIDWQDHKVQVISEGAAGLSDLAMDIVKARLRQPVK